MARRGLGGVDSNFTFRRGVGKKSFQLYYRGVYFKAYLAHFRSPLRIIIA